MDPFTFPQWWRIKVRRKALDLPSASPAFLQVLASIRNPVMRVGAFSEGRAKKAALDEGCDPTFRGKTQIHKERRFLSRNRYYGSRHPLPLTPSWMAKGYLHQTSHLLLGDHSREKSKWWGPRLARVKGSAVNIVECAGKEYPIHFSSDLRGWTCFAIMIG